MPRLISVIPSILTDDPKALERMVRQAEGFTDYVQFDIMDGRFVPSRSIAWQQLMALKTRLGWEAHLMVQHPENYVEGFAQAGASKVIFHFEADTSAEAFVEKSRGLGLKVGLAVNPETRVPDFVGLTEKVDSILLLSVHPGFYGSPFIPEVLGKVIELRNSVSQADIGIDGGIKEANIQEVARTGVDAIYIGSAIFLQSNPAARYRQLLKLACEA